MKKNHNVVDLCGTIIDKPKVDHIVYGLPMYQFHIEVARLSGVKDTLTVQCAENKLPLDPEEMVDRTVKLAGRLRSYNKHTSKHSKLLIYILVNEMIICEMDAAHSNNLDIDGFLCKKPILRKVSSGKSICDIMIALPKSTRGSKDYIPAICWGVVAQEVAEKHEGDFVSIKGRLQSREYSKTDTEGNTTTYVTYEVSVYACTVMSREEYDKVNEADEASK